MRLIKKILLCMRMNKIISYGEDVWVGKNCSFLGNIEIGSHVNIGRGANFVSTLATIHIHDYVVIGPEVSIYTGDHAIDVIGKHVIEVSDQDKNSLCVGMDSKYDQDVTIEAGCWIGTRAIILKGVSIGRGSIIGAGAIVTRNVPPYTIYVGVPSVKTRKRFSEEQIKQHEKVLIERGVSIK